MTPLHVATEANSFNIVEYLIDKGADFNINDGDGVSETEKVLYPLFKNKIQLSGFWRMRITYNRTTNGFVLTLVSGNANI